MARRKFLAQLASLPFLAWGTKAAESKKSLKIMMKSAWGSVDPTRASFPFLHGLALADAGHDSECDSADRLAIFEGDAGKNRGKAYTGFFLRSLLPGPWGHGNRFEQLGSKMGQPDGFRLTRGMGRPDHC
jgi:hypothetical protein